MAYISNLSNEVLWCSSFARNQYPIEYQIAVNHRIENHIKPNGFEISDLKLELDYNAIMRLLMGVNLYFDRKYGLRELIQNSIDACRIMNEEALEIEHYRYDTYSPRISIIVDEKSNRLIVMDNGIGMKFDILKKYFLNIGKSYYKSNDFLFLGKKYHPIGTFGIGFLACFMLSNNVIVETKHFTEMEGFSIELEADSEFVSMKRGNTLIREAGTAIVLELNNALKYFFQNPAYIKSYIEDTFLNQSVEMKFICIEDGINDEIKLLDFSSLNPNSIRLDRYLNGISATIQILSDEIRVYKKFSDFCGRKNNIYEYNPITKHFCYRDDIEGEELKKYIEKNQLLVCYLEVEKKRIYFPMSPSGDFDGAVTLDWVSKNGFKRIKISNVRRRSNGVTRHTLISTEDNRFVGYGHVMSGDAKTYLHGICVEAGVRVPETMYGVEFGNLAVDIKRNDVELDVSRRYLMDRERIEGAIGRAVNLYIADKILDGVLKKEILSYVDKVTPADNIYNLN